MKNKNTKAAFDPLLFDGLGSDRDRKLNNILYTVFANMNAIMFILGIVIIAKIQEHSEKTWFAILKVFSEVILLLYCLVLLYCYYLIWRHTKANKYINKNNPILICEYQGNFRSYCAWIFGGLFMFIFYVFFFMLSFIAPPFMAIVLYHFYFFKPFLLKRILLFENYVILEYKIFGNIKLDREGLVLMKTTPSTKTINLSFVRPMIFDTNKHTFFTKYLVAYFCLQFSKFGMNNIDKIYVELNDKMQFNSDEIIARWHRMWIYAFRYPLKEGEM
ncbi:hypothetical protein [Campylobacter troglodytis]|uniref:hypothetical protein n=1 Tax=Campylobacter troglodytis TaxID=654363 RepID=UPI0011572179|nr:hypothetical protein [Campylobacter troglodytis]TQR61493.1 hypothetical protein DMC01_00500 [Campylobacter troglodytis]